MTKIKNKCKLPYKIIGSIMDDYINQSPEDTLYEGKIDIFDFVWRSTKYHVQIRYMKRDIEWRFTEVGDIDD